MFQGILKAIGLDRPAPSERAAAPHVRRFDVAGAEDRPQAMSYLERGDLRGPTGGNALPGVPGTYGAGLRTADLNLRRDWARVTAHARTLIENSGYLSGSVNIACAYTIGRGLVPSISPDAEALGWTKPQAREWARRLERKFIEWADDAQSCDARGQQTLGGVQNSLFRSWFATGDILAALDYGPKRGSRFKTAVNPIDPARMMVPPIWGNGSKSNRTGIEYDDRGRPVAYNFAPLAGAQSKQPIRIAAYGSNGRRLVLHVFEGESGTVRGISPFAPVIAALAQCVSLHDAMLMAAHASASLIGTVTSDLPTSSVAQGLNGMPGAADMMADRVSWHEGLAKLGAHLKLGAHGQDRAPSLG